MKIMDFLDEIDRNWNKFALMLVPVVVLALVVFLLTHFDEFWAWAGGK